MVLTLLQQPYVDNSGVSHPDAVWYPALVTMDNLGRTGQVVWYAYHSQSTFARELAPVGSHSTQVDTSAFVAASAQTVSGQTMDLVVGQDIAVGFGKGVLDTPATDANGQPTMVAFFAGATIITVSV